MKLNRFVYIFVALIALSLVGCGSSSNPASSGNVSNGLVNVSGNVKNLNGSGSVSFYTPTAAARSNLNVATSFRASVVNDGVYTFNTDEKGNYSGQIPEGDYYVIAQNSDGTMKSVSAKQTFRAAEAETPATGNTIILTKTTEIKGTLNSKGSGNTLIPAGGVPVCIVGKPFISVTDSYGEFVFNGVPTLANGETYTLKATITEYGFSATAEGTVTSSNIANNHALTLESSEDNKNNFCAIYGTVYNNNTDKQIQPGKLVLAILNSGEIVSTISNSSDGTFSLYLNKNETPVQITANPRTFYEATISENLITPTYTDNEVYTFETQGGITPTPATINGIHIKEPISNGFKKTNDSTLTIFYCGNDNSMIELLSERFYFPATYTVNNINKEYTHWYVLESRDYEKGTYGFRICDSIEFENNENFATATHDKSIVISQPTITISEGNYVLSSSFSEVEGGMDSNVNVDAYAVRQGDDPDDPNNQISLTLNADNVIKFDNLGGELKGVFNIHAGYTITYADQSYIRSIYADPVIYVKHNDPQ